MTVELHFALGIGPIRQGYFLSGTPLKKFGGLRASTLNSGSDGFYKNWILHVMIPNHVISGEECSRNRLKGSFGAGKPFSPISKHSSSRSCFQDTPAALVLRNRALAPALVSCSTST